MKKLTRRRFIALCGMAVPGIWLPSAGMIYLPAGMVFAMSGSCSFCGKGAHELFGLAGVTGANARVCNECIEVCFEILADDPRRRYPGPPREVSSTAAGEDILNRGGFFQELLDRVVAGERGDPLVDALAEALGLDPEKYQSITEYSEPLLKQFDQYACSFCGKSQELVAQLIAGARAFICDVCVGDAGALFMRYGWQPTV